MSLKKKWQSVDTAESEAEDEDGEDIVAHDCGEDTCVCSEAL